MNPLRLDSLIVVSVHTSLLLATELPSWNLRAFLRSSLWLTPCSPGAIMTRKLSRASSQRHTLKLFSVPSGNAGSAFVSELAHLFQAYAEVSALPLKRSNNSPSPSEN